MGSSRTLTLFDRLESLFLEMEKRTGLKKHRILLEAGIDPAQYRAYKRANRALSDDMLDRLGKSEHGFSLSSDRLRVAVNNIFADWDQPLRANDSVVFIPPVAGG